MADQTISIHSAQKDTTGKYIIGIKNGVAMVRYPNKENFRAEVAADGFDIITVDEEKANLLWKKAINLSAEIVEPTDIKRKN
ncbi:hypothetical protein ACQWTT_001233 [Acinetobacter baumannii]